MIQYKCGSCGEELESPAQLAGWLETCPFCRNQTRVPNPEIESLERREKARKRKYIIVCLAIAGLALGATFHFVFCEWSTDYTHCQVIIPTSEKPGKPEYEVPGGRLYNGLVPRHSHEMLRELLPGGQGGWRLLHHGISLDQLNRGTWFGVALPLGLMVASGLVLVIGWPRESQ